MAVRIRLVDVDHDPLSLDILIDLHPGTESVAGNAEFVHYLGLRWSALDFLNSEIFVLQRFNQSNRTQYSILLWFQPSSLTS